MFLSIYLRFRKMGYNQHSEKLSSLKLKLTLAERSERETSYAQNGQLLTINLLREERHLIIAKRNLAFLDESFRC